MPAAVHLANGSIVSSGVMWWVPPTPAVSSSTAAELRETQGAVAFAAVVAFSFILLLSPQNWFPALKPLRIAFLAAGLGIASLLWDCWKHRRSLGLSREILTCFALPAWAFLTLPLSYWPGGSVATLTDLYMKAVIVFWLLPNVVTTKRRLLRLATVLMLCTVPLAGVGVKNFLSGMFITEVGVARIVGYDAGLSANPNDLALMLNLLIPVGMALFVSAMKTSVRIFWLIVLAIDVLGVIVTFSRAGFLALAAIGVTYFVKLVRRPGRDRAWAFAMLMVAMVSLPLLPSTYVNRVATVTDIDSDITGSSQARWRDTIAAARFVMEHPIIGAGIGMDAMALNTVRGEKWTKVHNVYFQYAVDLGVPGIALFLLLFYGVFKAASSSRRRLAQAAADRDLFLLAEALEISLIVFALSGLFYPCAYHFYFYYMAGLALAARSVTNDLLVSSHRIVSELT
jgi:putative inorganic carbon (hco3(-)) transporter